MFENFLPDFTVNSLVFYFLTGAVLITGFLILCRVFLALLSKVFETVCDSLEYKLARRRVRRTYFHAGKKNKTIVTSVEQAPDQNAQSKTSKQMKTNSLNSTRKGRIINAHNALRRNAESYSNRHKN